RSDPADKQGICATRAYASSCPRACHPQRNRGTRVGLPFRQRDKSRRGLRQPLAPEDRPRPAGEAYSHDSRSRLPARSSGIMRAKTLRSRMMVLFCSVVGVLLAASYLAFWALLARAIPAQLNRQLLETSRPILADIASEPNARDVERLDIPGQFFEVLDGEEKVLQRSRNLTNPIDLKSVKLNGLHPVFGIAAVGNSESVRVALIPFEQAAGHRFLAIAIPTFGTNRLLDTFGGITLLLFPLSLLLTAAISAFYVGKSLTPIKALTRHAELMAKRVTDRQGFWEPLPIASPHDELGRLADTFNQLLPAIDSAVRQLRQF